MGKVKQIEIKNQTYYFYNDITNIEEFDSNLLKMEKKNNAKILIFTTLDTSQLKKLMIVKRWKQRSIKKVHRAFEWD